MLAHAVKDAFLRQQVIGDEVCVSLGLSSAHEVQDVDEALSVELKQSIEVITQIVERQFPAWRPVLDVAWGAYHKLSGEPARALARLHDAIAAARPGRHAAWAAAAELLIEVLTDLGELESAVDTGNRALGQCRQEELGFFAEQGIERALALSEVAAGQAQTSAERLERRPLGTIKVPAASKRGR